MQWIISHGSGQATPFGISLTLEPILTRLLNPSFRTESTLLETRSVFSKGFGGAGITCFKVVLASSHCEVGNPGFGNLYSSAGKLV